MENDKNLKDKAIQIKGKDYVMVKDRIIFFNENYNNGSIITELLSDCTSDRVVIKATVFPDCTKKERFFTGYSQAVIGDGYINKTAALENAETSAVGRALAMMGIGVLDSIASVDEINKASGTETKPEQKEDNREWLSDVNFKAALKRIEAGELDVYTSVTKTYKMKKDYFAELTKAYKIKKGDV